MYHPLTQPLVAPMVTGVAPRQGWQGIIKRQRVGLLRDVSESMSEDAKAADASRACSVLVQTLADPVNKDGFDVGVVDFTTTARCVQTFERATVVCGRIPDIVPDASTNVTAGIEEMLRQLDAADATKTSQERDRYIRPVVILFSDGHHNTGADPQPAAAILKEKADFVTAAFGDDADHVLLKELATSPQHFYALKDGRALRNFLAHVGVVVMSTRQNGIPATKALTQIKPVI